MSSHAVKPSVDLEGRDPSQTPRTRGFLRDRVPSPPGDVAASQPSSAPAYPTPPRDDTTDGSPAPVERSTRPVLRQRTQDVVTTTPTPRNLFQLKSKKQVLPLTPDASPVVPVSIRVEQVQENVDTGSPKPRSSSSSTTTAAASGVASKLWKRNDLKLELPQTVQQADNASKPKSPSSFASLSPFGVASPSSKEEALTNGSLRSPAPRELQRKRSTQAISAITDTVSKLKKRPSALELPTSSPSSPAAPHTAKLPASPLMPKTPLSATLMLRKNSGMAAQARENQKTKERDDEKRRLKLRQAAKHNRMFSFVDRDLDSITVGGFASKLPPLPRIRSSWLVSLGAIAAVLFLSSILRGSSSSIAKPSKVAAAKSAPSPQIVLPDRSGEHGPHFIHPEVARRPLGRKGKGSSWVGRILGRSSGSSKQKNGKAEKPSPAVTAAQPAAKAVPFKIAPAIDYAPHNPLPPPPVHNDAPERDSLILYRIIGNELPPRHKKGQLLTNLKFLLQHESDFSALAPVGPHPVHHANKFGSGTGPRHMHSDQGGLRVDKFFVLNRIADEELFNAVLGLLHLYSVPNDRVLVIPFESAEYARRQFKWDGDVARFEGWQLGTGHDHDEIEDIHMHTIVSGLHDEEATDPEAVERHDRARTNAKLKALDYALHEKNLYAMNNNGGRNFALRHGKSLPHARWILPLDGNAFLTPAAMNSIVQTLSVTGEGEHASRYVVMPMERLLDNGDILHNNSIAMVKRHNDRVQHDNAVTAAQGYHRSEEGMPAAKDEPQIGFRYDSTEEYEEAMRYGRRSKLELLWRLGAIPLNSGLHARTYPWEHGDREHITGATWASIPGVDGMTMTNILHRARTNTPEAEPERGALAFVRAGWVYRLFGGDASQELPTRESASLRAINRMRGVAEFLESVDEEITRGETGCETGTSCGFSNEYLWNIDLMSLERLRQQNRIKHAPTIESTHRFENAVQPAMRRASSVTSTSDPNEVALDATLIAVAGFVTQNATYSEAAANMIIERFGLSHALLHDEHVQDKSLTHEVGAGYLFPRIKEHGYDDNIVWHSARIIESDLPSLPFDVLAFDSSLLFDAVRLLTTSKAPKNALTEEVTQTRVIETAIVHLSHLLHSQAGISMTQKPPSFEAGAFYDLQVAALSAYLDDVKLLNRVLSRSHVRQRRLAMEPAHQRTTNKLEYYDRLKHGAVNVRARPWSQMWEQEEQLGKVNDWLVRDTNLRLLGI